MALEVADYCLGALPVREFMVLGEEVHVCVRISPLPFPVEQQQRNRVKENFSLSESLVLSQWVDPTFGLCVAREEALSKINLFHWGRVLKGHSLPSSELSAWAELSWLWITTVVRPLRTPALRRARRILLSSNNVNDLRHLGVKVADGVWA